MYQDRDFRERPSPVNVGDEIDVKIEAVGEKGDGIAKKEGFVLFVPNTKEGQEVKIRVTKVLTKVGFAEVIGESEGASQQEPSTGNPEASPVSPQKPAAEEPEEQKVEDTEDFGEEEKKE
ncbi:MAG: TRAM domain-containing protein [Nanoarchaeota archaeon]|nr:TRAM domain-containing protein [Nanoarchaeota archaeon]